jgi:probable F420-dependent oxidoreductase
MPVFEDYARFLAELRQGTETAMSTSIMFSGNGELNSQRIADLSSQAEKKGFGGLWFGETTLRDASVTTTIAASATKKIPLGTSIVNVFTRSPSQLALMGATINEYSDGRFTLGLGVSTAAIVESWHGQQFREPMERIDETVKLLRQYFAGERFSHQGKYSSPLNARLRTRPGTKIALAALNDRMIKKAGFLGDRVILNLYPSVRIKHALALLEEGWKESGKKERPLLSVMLYSYVLGDDDRGLDAAKNLVSFYASAPAYSKLFETLGFKSEARAMTEAWKAKDKDSVKKQVSREMIDQVMLLGKIRDLNERVKVYHDNGVDDVFISPSPFGNYEANIQEVINHYF